MSPSFPGVLWFLSQKIPVDYHMYASALFVPFSLSPYDIAFLFSGDRGPRGEKGEKGEKGDRGTETGKTEILLFLVETLKLPSVYDCNVLCLPGLATMSLTIA